jgi:hypothetical protein
VVPRFDCELAEAFWDCVLAVELPRGAPALRLEVLLPDLAAAGLFGAGALALLLEPLPPDPLEPVVERAEEAPDAELPGPLPVVPDGPDEVDCGRAAGLGGCGATGIEKRESSATRNHSLRPDAL